MRQKGLSWNEVRNSELGNTYHATSIDNAIAVVRAEELVSNIPNKPEMPTAPSVFISYTNDSDEHKQWVRNLAQRIERLGVRVWLDQNEFTPGTRWTDTLEKAWGDHNIAVVVFSGNGRNSEYARLELEVLAKRARSGGMKIIPVLRADGQWTDDMPSEFQKWQGIDMRDNSSFLENFGRLRTAILGTESFSRTEAADIHASRWLSRLRLKNVKLFEDFEIDLTGDDGRPRPWTCILASNGCGKTTVLQAIALSASGDTLATKLTDDARSFAPAFSPSSTVSIEADFMRSPDDTLRTRLELAPKSHDWFGAGQDDSYLRSLRSTRNEGFFIAGYGASRRLCRAGEVAVPHDPLHARLRSLFSSDFQLLGLEFGDALVDDERQVFLDLLNRLIQFQLYERAPLLPGVINVSITSESVPGAFRGDVAVTLDFGHGEFRLGPSLLSSGYQAVLSWLGELVGHLMLDFGGEIAPEDMQGIVLIDEIDQHLHPVWQRRIVPVLRALFPGIQFIVATHSPLVLTGFSASEIVAIELQDGRLCHRDGPLPEPAMQSGSQLYANFFDTPIAGRPDLEEKDAEFMSLYARRDSISEAERTRLAELRDELTPYWDAPFRDPVKHSSVPNEDELKEMLAELEADS